jgi:PAS domain S-box-containing protein
MDASKVARDTPDRERAGQSTNLLAAIVDCSDDAIISKDLHGVITSWNKSAERIFGYTPEEAIGQHIRLIIPQERHAEESDILDRLRRGERIDHFHTVRRRKDGSLLEVSLTISPVRDLSGRVIGASKVARDITAQKEAQRALQESERRFRVITDASPIMVWLSGTDKLCYYFNKGWLDFVGRTLEQESGNGWAENVHPEDFDRCLQIYVSNFDARRPFEMEYRMRHHTGQYRWILDRGVPRYAPDGTFEGYVGGCLDIQFQKEAAEKVRIAEDMTRLMKAQDEERRHIARELHDSAGQTLAVLNMRLGQLIQRADGIVPELAREGKSIEEIVHQLTREIRTASYLLHPPLLDETGLGSALGWYVDGLAERSHIRIKLEVAGDVGRLPSDMELAIFRVVQECLTNVHRHSGSETALIRVVRDEESVRTEVQDHGKGISAERLLEIQSHGSGVGLRGIRERIRPFHGEMKIESNGSGTSVIVRIPIPREARSAASEPLQTADSNY